MVTVVRYRREMPAAFDQTYPGESATAAQVRTLADHYREAARTLSDAPRRGEPMPRSPYRLLAIQAIELYLNGFLLGRGATPVELRRLQHDLAARADLAVRAGLVLRVRTLAHLRALGQRREYLTCRYAAEGVADLSHLNRLAATLEEVAVKTAAAPQAANRPSRPQPSFAACDSG